MRAFAEWLYGTAPSVAVHSTFWLIRLLQATHLLVAGVVAATGIMLALRALGWQRAEQPFEAVWQRFGPWLGWGLIVMISTGIAQTLGDPVRELTSTSYWVKLALLLGCVLGTFGLVRAARRAPPGRELSAATRLIAAWLVLSWLALPMLGRTIGYDLAIWGEWSLRE